MIAYSILVVFGLPTSILQEPAITPILEVLAASGKAELV